MDGMGLRKKNQVIFGEGRDFNMVGWYSWKEIALLKRRCDVNIAEQDCCNLEDVANKTL